MKDTYSPKEFGKLIGKAVVTLQKWDRKGILRAYRTPTNRRYYKHEQYLQVTGQKAVE
jgi:DNA-binding transcriptional MerR regulator